MMIERIATVVAMAAIAITEIQAPPSPPPALGHPYVTSVEGHAGIGFTINRVSADGLESVNFVEPAYLQKSKCSDRACKFSVVQRMESLRQLKWSLIAKGN